MGLKNKIIGGIIAAGILAGGIYFENQYSRNKSRAKYLEKWNESQKPIVATVLSESYENTLSPVEKWSGFVSHSNPTVKLDSKYSLRIKTEDGRVLGLSIIDGGTAKKEGLDQIIEKGSIISFPTGNVVPHPFYLKGAAQDYEETWFKPETQVGTKMAHRITVLK